MSFNPNLHHRRSIRLQEYDYRQPGSYFITICTFEKSQILGSVEDGMTILSEIGLVVEQCLLELPKHFPHLEIDSYVIMPNHTHSILNIHGNERRGDAFAIPTDLDAPFVRANASPKIPGDEHDSRMSSGSLFAVIRTFKSITSRRINKIVPGTLWQRGYYEHVIRNDEALEEIREYIASNPWNWLADEYHTNT